MWPSKLLSAVSPVLCAACMSFASLVHAVPIWNQSSSNTTSSNNNSSNRNGGFQILADGTQDLAALVGLFATDGVERYTIDYTRGLLPPVTAPLSMLGLLGYVRALLKLGLGVEFCERTGFSVASLRSYAGVNSRDISQSEKITEVHYLKRTISESSIQWHTVKTVPHTQDSMPLITGNGIRASRDRRTHDSSFGIAMCSLGKRGATATLAFGLPSVCLASAASISSLPVLLFTSALTWTRLFASVGLTSSVLLGGLPWCLIYIIEHLPFDDSDCFRSDWKHGPISATRSADDPGQSLLRKNTLAYFKKDNHFYIFDCCAVPKLHLWLVRAASCCAAVCITIAYICQYIQLRQASAKFSGIWLGFQGLLAIIRIVAWDWAPNVLGFSTETAIRWTDQRDQFFKNSLTELEITLCWASLQGPPPTNSGRIHNSGGTHAPPIPKWVVEKLDDIRLAEAFELGNRLRTRNTQAGDFGLFESALEYWDMPDIFSRGGYS
ncbi:hypothetical protein MMC28_003814 [Mycoblastus sanguinarius]|nr:hypothetical protein [Mycoblastus sanguinarius]